MVPGGTASAVFPGTCHERSPISGRNPMRLELRGITKRLGALVPNDHIDLVIEPGEIHALLGENGAGKSTLMNVLYGLYDPDDGEILVDDEPHAVTGPGAAMAAGIGLGHQPFRLVPGLTLGENGAGKSTLMNVLYGLYDPDDGEILVDDEPVAFTGPGDAMAAGIGMVHQHFMLVPVFTVAENVALGHEPVKGGGLIDARRARSLVREISDRFGFEVDPDAMVEDIPVGVQQRVEIIKALSRDARVLILDEPTAVLTPQETDELIAIMRQLKEAGTSIVFITHKLREVRAVADRITVIRRGKVVGTADPSASETELASLMVGRSVSLGVDKEPARPGDATFRVTDLTVMDDLGTAVVDRVSLDVARGEILVVAGVQGNGQTELTETIVGLRKPVAGSITLDDTELVGRGVADVLAAGVGYVPEDRSTDGIVGTFSVEENLVLDLFDRVPYSRGGALNKGAIRDNAE